MTDNRSASVAAPPKRGKGLFITGIVLLVLGAVATFLGIAVPAGTAKEIQNLQVSAAATAPTTFTVPLNAATTYAVYSASGTGTITAADVTVTSADGTSLTVKQADSATVKGEGGKEFTEVAWFDIGTSGTFAVKVAGKDALVAVAPSASTIGKGAAWVVALLVGPLLALVGLILVIVGAVRRSK